MKIKINGKDVVFNPYDLKDSERFEKALDQMEKDEKAIQNIISKMQGSGKGMYVVVGKCIDMVKKFFITTTNIDVIDDCTDWLKVREMYDTFLKEVSKEKKKFAQFSSKRIH